VVEPAELPREVLRDRDDEEEKPPPIHEVIRVPVDDERARDPGQLRAATDRDKQRS
jgi:hypothetical protein